MTAAAITAQLLQADETVISTLRIDGPQSNYSELLSDAGAAQVTIPGDVAVDLGQLVRFKKDGSTDFTMRIEPPLDRTVEGKVPSEVQSVIHGRDWVAEFDDVCLAPPMGRGVKPEWSEGVYDWRHPIVPLTGSVAPTYLGSLFTADVDPLGGAASAPPTAKSGYPPEDWVDTFTGWNSGAAVDGSGSHATTAVAYATLDLPVTSGFLCGQWSADDTGELAVGGVLLDSCTTWWKSRNWGLDDVDTGTLTIRMRIANAVVPGNPSNVGNPLAWALTAYQPTGSNQSKVFANVIARTGANTGPTDALTDGGKWSVLWSPASPPGITVARAVRHQFDLAQARGLLTGWTLDFSDTLDSDGASWTARSDISWRTNDTMLAWLRQLAARGMCDFGANQSARELRLWLPGQRGDFHTTPGSPPAWTGSHTSGVDVTRRW